MGAKARAFFLNRPTFEGSMAKFPGCENDVMRTFVKVTSLHPEEEVHTFLYQT